MFLFSQSPWRQIICFTLHIAHWSASVFTLNISASCSTLICFLCFHYESVTLSRPGSWFNEGGVTSEKKQQACGFDSNVFVVNTVVNIGPVQIVPTQLIAVMARKIKHKHFQKESTFLLSRASGPRETDCRLKRFNPSSHGPRPGRPSPEC